MRKYFLIISLLFFATAIWGQLPNPVNWDFKVIMIHGCDAELVFVAQLKQDWHLYSQKYNPNPLFFEFAKSPSFSCIGEVTEPTPVKEYDDIMKWDMVYFKESEVVFTQRISITNDEPFKIVGKMYGQVCQNSQGVCLPLNADFIFEVPQCPGGNR